MEVIMNNLKKYLVAFTMMVAVLGFTGCGNRNVDEETSTTMTDDTTNQDDTSAVNETDTTTTEQATTDNKKNTGNSGNVSGAVDTDGDGVVDEVVSDVVDGVENAGDAIVDGMEETTTK